MRAVILLSLEGFEQMDMMYLLLWRSSHQHLIIRFSNAQLTKNAYFD